MDNNESKIDRADLLEDKIISSGINIYELRNKDTASQKGIAFKFNNGLKAIVINEDLIESKGEKVEVLEHEHQHFEHPSSFYNLTDCPYSIKRKEYLINKATIRSLISEQQLFDYIYIFELTIEEIAEREQLSFKFIVKALNYYSQLESWQDLKLK